MSKPEVNNNAQSTNGSDSFTTYDFIDKLKETIGLAREIVQNSNVKKNEKIQDLLKIQCCNTLKILTKLNQNDLNPNSRSANFTRLKFDDQQKIAKLVEINDALVDKTIHYFDAVKNCKQKNTNQNLIQVQMNVNTERNDSSIFIRDFKQTTTNKNDHCQSEKSKQDNKFSPMAGSKRKYPEWKQNEPKKKIQNIFFMAAASVKRPQVAYKIKVDNAYSTPFIPKLTRKPNAIVSLEDSIKPVAETNQPMNKFLEKYGITYPSHSYPHPYQHEIENFVVPEEFFSLTKQNDPIEKPSAKFDDKKLILINTRDQLNSLVQILKTYKEIAVDLEHHSFRSYQGLTCLLQLSTDDCDYIIDVFPLWYDMELLNEIFTCPTILKVFHSSQFDLMWLQRDLGIYVVNMFDTWIASTVLNYQHVSLSSLVSQLCDYQLDKRFQLADWRMRPLPDEMVQYGRCDTYFLLYIYRYLRKELLQKGDQNANLLRVVMERSQKMCLKKYEKKLLDINDHVHLIWKNNLHFNPRQMQALKSLYIWRDIIARHEDESTGYVLPNNLLLKICEILPREQQGVLACCNPIPPLVRQYINEIHKIILEARSRVNIDESADTGMANQEKRYMTIDLTNDLMMDNIIDQNKPSSMDITDQHPDHGQDSEHHDEKHGSNMIDQTPMMVWSKEMNKFIVNHKTKSTAMDIDLVRAEQPPSCSSSSSSSSSSSLIDMFTKNLSKHFDGGACLDDDKKTVPKLFDGYITFYQRYLIKMKKNEAKKLKNNKT